MGLIHDHGLYVFRPPEVEPLLLAAALLSGEIQVFHDDAVHIILYGRIHDEPGGLDRNVIVDALCLFPETWCFMGTELLCMLDVADRMLQGVVFSDVYKRQVTKQLSLDLPRLYQVLSQ